MKTANSPLARITGTLVFTVFLVLVLAFAIQATFQTREQISDTFSQESQLQHAAVAFEELRRLQLEEESAVRGYIASQDPFYEQQYLTAVATFDNRAFIVKNAVREQRLTTALALLNQYLTLQNRWRTHIALPRLENPTRSVVAFDKANKTFSDFESRTASVLRRNLAGSNLILAQRTQYQINRTLYVRALWLLLFGILAILFNAYGTRLNRELDVERSTVDILQRAFRSEHVPLPNCEVGSAYLAASSVVAVGGDIFDVYRLSDRLALILIADVSGKGVDAAVITAFIKFTMRGIALRRRDPGAMLAEFNTAFAKTVENPYIFVSMLVGVLDTTTGNFQYASAGHDSAFLRRSQEVRQLAITGPILGVMEEPFETKVLALMAGDTLVLATDGLTEARNRDGELLHEEGAMRLIARCNERPQLLADELVAQVKALGGNKTQDDVAILAIRILEPKSDVDEQ